MESLQADICGAKVFFVKADIVFLLFIIVRTKKLNDEFRIDLLPSFNFNYRDGCCQTFNEIQFFGTNKSEKKDKNFDTQQHKV